MSWDRKRWGGSRRYFYLSVRAPGQPGVKKIYVGRGSAGHAVAAVVESRRLERNKTQERLRKEKAAFNDVDLPLSLLHRDTSELLAEWLVAHGYHNHRGEWRRKHGRQNRVD